MSSHQPDLELLVKWNQELNRLDYSLTSLKLNYEKKDLGDIKLFYDNPGHYFQEALGDFWNGQINKKSHKNPHLPCPINQGKELFRKLLPEKLQEVLIGNRSKIGTLSIITSEPWIPWELLAFPDGTYFCDCFVMARWYPGPSAARCFSLKKNLLVAPEVAAPIARQMELDIAEQHLENCHMPPSPITLESLTNTLESSFDLIHFLGHAKVHESDANRNFFLLDEASFTPIDVASWNISGRPLVFMNACSTARDGFSLTGIGGWAQTWHNAGAGAFIGTLWPVPDIIAAMFARNFYRAFCGGVNDKPMTLGEAMIFARNKVKDGDDTSWLAFTLFGHPDATYQSQILPESNRTGDNDRDKTDGEKSTQIWTDCDEPVQYRQQEKTATSKAIITSQPFGGVILLVLLLFPCLLYMIGLSTHRERETILDLSTPLSYEPTVLFYRGWDMCTSLVSNFFEVLTSKGVILAIIGLLFIWNIQAIFSLWGTWRMRHHKKTSMPLRNGIGILTILFSNYNRICLLLLLFSAIPFGQMIRPHLNESKRNNSIQKISLQWIIEDNPETKDRRFHILGLLGWLVITSLLVGLQISLVPVEKRRYFWLLITLITIGVHLFWNMPRTYAFARWGLSYPTVIGTSECLNGGFPEGGKQIFDVSDEARTPRLIVFTDKDRFEIAVQGEIRCLRGNEQVISP